MRRSGHTAVLCVGYVPAVGFVTFLLCILWCPALTLPVLATRTMAPYLSRALCALALVAHASALALRAPVRAPLALGRRTALLRMALPASVMEFVPDSVASDTAQMKQIGETWKVCAPSQASSRVSDVTGLRR